MAAEIDRRTGEVTRVDREVNIRLHGGPGDGMIVQIPTIAPFYDIRGTSWDGVGGSRETWHRYVPAMPYDAELTEYYYVGERWPRLSITAYTQGGPFKDAPPDHRPWETDACPGDQARAWN